MPARSIVFGSCVKKKEETNPEIHKEFTCNFETIFSDLMVITNLL